MGRIGKVVLIVGCIVGLAGSVFVVSAQDNAGQGQAVPTVFRSDARLVVVDVVVTDSKGEPVTGLGKEAFSLTEDGKEQNIVSFEANVAALEPAPAAQTEALPPNLFTNAPLTRRGGPVTVILFDVLNTSPQSAGYARQQMLKFLEQLPPNQQVALFFLGTRLRMLQGPTGRTDELIAAAKRLLYEKVPLQGTAAELEQNVNSLNYAAGIAAAAMGSPNPRAAFKMEQVLRDEAAIQRRQRVDYTIAAMKQLAQALSGYPGRKNIIWLTESFPLSTGPNAAASSIREDPLRHSDNFLNDVHELGTILANQQVALYPIDVGGMRTRGQDASASVEQIGDTWSATPGIQSGAIRDQFESEEANRATMINVADETGGRPFFRTNDLALAARKSLEAGATYYTLAYRPTNTDWRGQYRHIKVKALKPDVKLEYRRGYYAYQEATKIKAEDSRKLLMEAMQPGLVPYTGLLFKAQVQPHPQDKSRIVIQYAIDPRTVSFTDTADGKKSIALDFFAVASTPKQKDAGHASDSLDPTIKVETFNAVLRSSIPASQELVLKPGEYSLRLGIIDRNTQKMGTLVVPLAVNP